MPPASLSQGALPPGSVIAGKYRVVRRLGEGGMGAVYEAEHVRLGHQVAIKVLLPHAFKNPEARVRFEREARIAASLKNEHTVRVLDVDSNPDGEPFLVMELLQGHSLADELASRGPLPWPEVVRHAIAVCSAMHEAHGKGVVHRDLKPSNLFLHHDEGRVVLKVLDFGISKSETSTGPQLTHTVATLGTPLYMSPEHVRSSKEVDARSDVWSLGVIMFELLAGRPPFLGDSATAVAAAIVADPLPPIGGFRDDLPRGLDHLLTRALAKTRAQRLPSMLAFKQALARFDAYAVSPELAPLDDDSEESLTLLAAAEVREDGESVASEDGTDADDLQLSATRPMPKASLALGSQPGVSRAQLLGLTEAPTEQIVLPAVARTTANTRVDRRPLLVACAVGALAALSAVVVVMRLTGDPAPAREPAALSASVVGPNPAGMGGVPSAEAVPAVSASAIPSVTTGAPDAGPSLPPPPPPTAKATGGAKPPPSPPVKQKKDAGAWK